MRNKGFTVVEILVSIGILAIIGTSMALSLSHANRMKAQTQGKLEVVTLETAVQSLLSRREDCDCQVVGKSFDADNLAAAEFDLTELKMSCSPGARDFVKTMGNATSTATHAVRRIYVKNLYPTGNSNEYGASLFLDPEDGITHFQTKSTPIRFRFNTNPGSPANAKVISSCGAASLSVPQNIVTVPGDAECNVSWVPSAGAPPISYIVQASKTAGQAAVTGVQVCNYTANTSCLAQNLENGSTYYFSVRASNAQGESNWSAEATCAPSQPPSEPSIETFAGTASCQIRVQKSAQGTAPLRYSVYRSETLPVTKASARVCSDLEATGNYANCDVTGLTNGSVYYFAAIAANDKESNLSLPVSCEPVAPCSGSVTVTLVDPGGCLKGRRAGDYPGLTLTGINSDVNGSNYFVRGTMSVRKQQPCATVYCPISFTCDKGTLVPNSTSLTCTTTPQSGAHVSSYPSKTTGVDDELTGWEDVRLYRK